MFFPYRRPTAVSTELEEIMTDNLMTPDAVAAYVVLPKTTLYAYSARGLGPKRYKVGKHLRYRKEDVDAWLEQQARPSGPALGFVAPESRVKPVRPTADRARPKARPGTRPGVRPARS